jgi:hypothetical protein
MIILFIHIAHDICFYTTGHYLDITRFINSCSTSGANEISGFIYLFFFFFYIFLYLVESTFYNDLLGDCSTMIVVNSPVNVSDVDGVDMPQCYSYSSSENVMCRFFLFFYFC